MSVFSLFLPIHIPFKVAGFNLETKLIQYVIKNTYVVCSVGIKKDKFKSMYETLNMFLCLLIN